jgi:hypothetical protein
LKKSLCVVSIAFLSITVSAQFFVAPNGNDNNSGARTAPFQTFEKAQTAMRTSAVKTTCIRAGIYRRATTLMLSNPDSGETWRYFPPDGVNSAALDGGNKVSGGLIAIKGASNITINGLKIENFVDWGIIASGGRKSEFGNLPIASANTVENCDVASNTVTSWSSAAIAFLGAVPGTIVKNNYVHDTGSQGIVITTYFLPADGIGGSAILNNVIMRAVQRMYDGSGIYVGMHGGYQAAPAGVIVSNNFVRDYGSVGLNGPYGASHIGIYLDDNANNVLVTGNTVGPPTEGSVDARNLNHVTATLVHNGHDNHITGNIFDLGDSGRVLTAVWARDSHCIAGMAGNTFTGNIIVSAFTGLQRTSSSGIVGFSYMQDKGPPSDFLIRHNVYFNYAGGQVRTDGRIAGDSNPIIEDPRLSGWTYAIARSSPVFSGPVNFPVIAGGWGPPGYVIPGGTLPSCPLQEAGP